MKIRKVIDNYGNILYKGTYEQAMTYKIIHNRMDWTIV